MVLSIVDSTMSGLSDNSATSDVCTAPSGVADKDWVYLVLEMWWNSTSNPTVTWPTGFTERVNYVNSVDQFQKLKIARKKSSGSEPASYTMSWTGQQEHWVQSQAVAVRGADETEPEHVAINLAQNQSGTGYPSNGVTTSVACMLLHICCNENGTTPASNSPPTGFTEREDANYLRINTKLQSAAGTDNISGGGLSTSTPKLAALIALKEASSGATDLVIQDAAIGVSSDNIVITQEHTLVIQEASHIMSADNILMTQTHMLTVQDATITQTADNLTLTQHIDLAIQKAVMAMSSDNLNLSQVHQITIHKAFLQTAADVVNMSGEDGGIVSVTDVQVEKLQALTSSTGSIQDLEHKYYGSLSGLAPVAAFSVSDHQKAYYAAQTGLSGSLFSMADLERAFYDVQLVPSGSLADREYVYWSSL